MRRSVHLGTTSAWLLAVLALGLAACEKQSDATQKKLDAFLARIDALERKVDAKGYGRPGAAVAAGQPGKPGQPGQPGQPQQRPPGPDPKTVYAVPVDGDAYEGPAVAKITIVEASDFA